MRDSYDETHCLQQSFRGKVLEDLTTAMSTPAAPVLCPRSPWGSEHLQSENTLVHLPTFHKEARDYPDGADRMRHVTQAACSLTVQGHLAPRAPHIVPLLTFW